MERYICVHGHFYQPPRENPWLEAVELQDSAYPYHDWNERITSECYATNATSRILNEKGEIAWIVNNYSRISFNFGPTLLAWMEENTPDVYQAIIEADRESSKIFSGHGSALAQAYNHMIMPLANRRDKFTQIIWGIRDFEHRFGRRPEGMWLPETAVDLETLDILAQQDIRFTLLAPKQAGRVRPGGEDEWEDVSGGAIDPTMAYRQSLPEGRSIVLFFYDDPISRAVAFEGLLGSGEDFALRLTDGFSRERNRPQLVHIATDGESYGHHHKHGDMALAYALRYIESRNLARLTNYGEYLEKNPPTHEVEIVENTSWSCVHGVERWKSDCGCNSGAHKEWNQAWRGPLRDSLDWLRDNITTLYEKEADSLVKDPWEARDEYISVVLDRSPERAEGFLERHASRDFSDEQRTRIFKLMELQRNAMLMYTSCGWFFDELSGLETVQILKYAGRAIQLAEELFEEEMESRFLERLETAKSNLPQHVDGRKVYTNLVKPAVVDLFSVGAHFAMSSLFEDYKEQEEIFCFRVGREYYEAAEAGRLGLAVGRALITSEVTGESERVCFGILHWGDHNLSGCVRRCQKDEPHAEQIKEILKTFEGADFPETLQLMEKEFGVSTYSLTSLFKDEQRKILELVLESTLADVEALYSQVYESNVPILRFLRDHGIPQPRALYTAAEFITNSNLRSAFQGEEFDMGRIRELLEIAEREGVSLDSDTLEMAVRRRMENMARKFIENPGDLVLLRQLKGFSGLVESLPFDVNTREVQNVYYRALKGVYPQFVESSGHDERMEKWVEDFVLLGRNLRVSV